MIQGPFPGQITSFPKKTIAGGAKAHPLAGSDNCPRVRNLEVQKPIPMAGSNRLARGQEMEKPILVPQMPLESR